MRVAHSEFDVRLETRRGPLTAVTELPVRAKAAIGTTVGIVGGAVMALTLVVYGWASESHSALELPMAAMAWVFGTSHFTQNGYEWGPIVVGMLLLAGYAIVSGAVFGGVADRFLGLRTLPETLGAGLAWGFVSWLFFWYTLLPIAHGGAPFHATLATGALALPIGVISVAPIWVFVLAFAALGVATSVSYWLLARR